MHERNPLPPKLFEILRADEPSRAEIDEAYRRMRLRASPGIRPPVWLKTAALGMCLGGGVAFAASALNDPFARRISARASGAPAAAPSAQQVRPAGPLAPGVPLLLDSAPLVVGEAPSMRSNDDTREMPRASSKPSSTASDVRLPPRDPTSGSMTWQRAAMALRERDWNGARAALVVLEHSSDVGERDAARLALAQLMINTGQQSEGLRRLEDLSARARSPAVRAKAATLLRDSSKK